MDTEKNSPEKEEELSERGKIKKQRQADKDLTAANDKAYEKAKKTEDFVDKIKVEKGYKEKVIERRTYLNGVIKNKLVGLLVNGKIIYGRRPKKNHGVL